MFHFFSAVPKRQITRLHKACAAKHIMKTAYGALSRMLFFAYSHFELYLIYW